MADLRTRIIEHLKVKGTYDENVDDDMVDDLVENTMFTKKIFKQLKSEGAIIEYMTTSGSRMTKINPLLNAYQMMMRNVYQLSAKLGINRNDRLKLKIIEKESTILDKIPLTIKYGFTIPTIDLPKKLDAIKNFLKKFNVFTIGRYGEWKYSGIEHAIEDGKNIAQQLKNT